MKMNPSVIGLLAGAMIFGLSRNLPLSVLLGAVTVIIARRWVRARMPWARYPASPPPTMSTPPRSGETSTPIEVVCRQVAPGRQEWVSRKTGRLYDVTGESTLPGARPGDLGMVTLTETGWRISPLIEVEGEARERKAMALGKGLRGKD